MPNLPLETRNDDRLGRLAYQAARIQGKCSGTTRIPGGNKSLAQMHSLTPQFTSSSPSLRPFPIFNHCSETASRTWSPFIMENSLVEQEQILGHSDGNVMAFFRTCSKPDLNWFMDAVTADLLKMVWEFEGIPCKEGKGWIGLCSPEKLLVDTITHTVSFVESKPLGKAHDNIFTLPAIFLADFLAMALDNTRLEGPKQSRIRCKIAMIFAVEGIHERMRTAFSYGGTCFHKELWAQENLKQHQRLEGKGGAATHIAKAIAGIKQG